MSHVTFPKISKEEWLAKVTKDLKGRSIEELNWRITDEILMSPFEHDDELQQYPNLSTRTSNLWITVESIEVADTVQANDHILSALHNGASGISLRINQQLNHDELASLLSGVHLDMIHTEFLLNESVTVTEFSEELQSYLITKEYAPQSIQGAIYSSEDTVSLPDYTGIKYICAESSGNCTEQISDLLLQINKQIEHQIDNGTSICHNASSIDVSVTLSDTYLVNIAMIRALRRCMQLLLHSYNEQLTIEDIGIKAKVDAEQLDDDINYGRIQTSAMALSAVIGGASRIALYSTDQAKTSSDQGYDRRIARNISHILSMESYIDRVVDPAAGSYYIEALTEQVAKQAWQTFTQKWQANR